VQVVFGFIELKTHAKLSMVVRREAAAAHLLPSRHRQLSPGHGADLHRPVVLHLRPGVARDVARLFNFITGYAEPDAELESSSPSRRSTSRPAHSGHIEREIEHAKAGRPAQIWAKMNSLVDPEVIDALRGEPGRRADRSRRARHLLPAARRARAVGEYPGQVASSAASSSTAASTASATVTAAARPSEGLHLARPTGCRATSTAASRRWCRSRTVTVHDQVLDQIMVANLMDNQQSWRDGDGDYRRVHPGPDEKPFNLHHYFMTNPSLSGRGAALRSSGAGPRKLRLPRGPH
jgi:polyphosphate kinase